MTNEILVSISGLIGVKVKEQGIILAIILGSILITSQLTTHVYARNITAFVHFNEQVIKDGGPLKHQAWYTVDGKNYSRWHHDMIEALYPDEAGKGPEFDYVAEDELMVADNASQICFEDGDYRKSDYKACGHISGQNENATEIHFSYPASWVPDED